MTKKAAIIICFNAWNEISASVTIDFIKSIVDITNYPDYEIILYENNSKTDLFKKIFDYISIIDNIPIKVISPVNKIWYNMDREYNDATKISDAEIFIFANNDMKIINKDWLTNIVKWLESDNNLGLVCPHTNITYGNFFNCQGCILDQRLRKEIEEERKGNKTEIKYYSCLFTEGCARRFQDNDHILWYREWPTMGIYACTRSTLEKIGMHDTNMDLHAQDLSIILKFENAGFKIAVAMDSLVVHNEDKGHVTLDYIAKDGSDDYNFRSIYAYKWIYDYLKQNPHLLDIHIPLKIEWNNWYNNFYLNPSSPLNSPFKRDEYNKWLELHKDDWNNDVRYGYATVAIICTLQNHICTGLAINAIESILSSDIKGKGMERTEIIIYENNSDNAERSKFFDYINNKKLNTDINIKWISVNREKFNINKVYNRLSKFTRNEILCLANQDIEIINKDWLKNAISWMTHSEYRDQIGILLTTTNEFSRDMIVNIKKELIECEDKSMPVFFIKKYILDRIEGFDDKSLSRMIDKGLKLYEAKDVLTKISNNAVLK